MKLFTSFRGHVWFLVLRVDETLPHWARPPSPPDSRSYSVRCQGAVSCRGTCAETSFRLSAKRTSPFKSAGCRQFSLLLVAEVCAWTVVMLVTPCSEVVWRVLATHSIRQFPLHFPSRASPCAVTFQVEATTVLTWWGLLQECVKFRRSMGD